MKGAGYMSTRALLASLFLGVCVVCAHAADHNDPNAVNSIFADNPNSAADLYDMYGWPADDKTGGERVVLALTFASVPRAGELDPDILYKIKVDPDPRVESLLDDEINEASFVRYIEAMGDRVLKLKAAEIRVKAADKGKADLHFFDFPGGSFSVEVNLNEVVTITSKDGHPIKIYVGGRDDAFFSDLPGFFRSINYAPQFYHVPASAPHELRELPIPKTLLELEGNRLFNFDPDHPHHGQPFQGHTEKFDLPPGPHNWTGNQFKKDSDGNFCFVYSGQDAQAGVNVNAIILELPLAFITSAPESDRIVNAWGESWVLKASKKVELVADQRSSIDFLVRFALVAGALSILAGALLFLRQYSLAATGTRSWQRPWAVMFSSLALVVIGTGLLFYHASVRRANDLFLRSEALLDKEMQDYKLVDTDGVPFADAALCERENDRQRGANNITLGEHFVKRFAHLGMGFGPSVSALGLKCSVNHGDSPVSVHKTFATAAEAFPVVKTALFQQLQMPDDSWNPSGKSIPLRRAIEIFVPNVNAIDMDTTGTWPFGRRPEDQVATRFLSAFLDMSGEVNGQRFNVETLGDPSLWENAPIVPKTPPNPLRNDKPFLKEFPYLAEPW